MPSKMQIFFWRLLLNICRAMSALFKRGIVQLPICLRCGHQEESIEHLFFDCQLSKITWRISPLGLDFDSGHKESLLCLGREMVSTSQGPRHNYSAYRYSMEHHVSKEQFYLESN